MILGEPAYYARFGFLPADSLGLCGPYPVAPECFMALYRGTPPPAGSATSAPEFPAP